MANPAGYLFGIARNSGRAGGCDARRAGRRARGDQLTAGSAVAPDGNPGSGGRWPRSSERQRTAVLLVHGYGYTHADAATAMGCSPSTVRNHLARCSPGCVTHLES